MKKFHEERIKRGKDNGKVTRDYDHYDEYREKELGWVGEREKDCERGRVHGRSKVEDRDLQKQRLPRVNDLDTMKVRGRGKDGLPDTTFQEPTVGKGLSGALRLLQQCGTLKEGEEVVGRSMDKKKSNLVGIAGHGDGSGKEEEIVIERRDRFDRILTPKESFRMLCYAFHGRGPGKRKVEKRTKQEQKLKQMQDAPFMSVEKMREAQARLQSPYLVLSGHAKPAGQQSSGGFAIEKEQRPRRSSAPVLGDDKVGACLGIKRKPEPSKLDLLKKPKIIFSLKKPKTC